MKSLTLVAAITVGCVGAAVADEGKDESGKGKQPAAYDHHEGEYDRESYFHEHGYSRLSIPKGHYPPPGECRIWFPERPAGQQPPPGECNQLRTEVPPDAWLISHPADDLEHVHVIVYEPRRPGTVLVVGEFNIGSGAFVRIVVNK